jgi:hypothetical protein
MAKADVKLFVESSAQAAGPLGENALLKCRTISLNPQETKEIILKK